MRESIGNIREYWDGEYEEPDQSDDYLFLMLLVE